VSTSSIRRRGDANFRTTKALPAAAATNFTDAFDLGQTTLAPLHERLLAKFSVPATPSLANATTVTFTFQDSADGTTFAAIPELETLVVTGGGGVGAAAATRTVSLPPTTRRYVRVSQAVLTGAGDNTAISTTFELLF
jgi:hypothetical protein